MGIWQKKQKIISLMKEKVIDAPEDDDTDFFAIVDEAEVDLQRIMKNDMDNFVAKQN